MTTLTVGVIITLIVIGIFSGILSGLVGVGGGIIIVPCLVYFLMFPQKMAQGTSLAVLTLPVVLLGMLQYYKTGNVDFKAVGVIAIGFVVGSLFGGKIANNLPDAVIKKIFAVLLILIACKMLFLDKPKTVETNTTTELQQK